MTAEAYLAELGFEVIQRRRDGATQYARRATPYLVIWLTDMQGSADLTWEFSLGQYLADRGFSVSGSDVLSLLMFPSAELRGPLTRDWVQSALDQVTSALDALDFARGV